MSLLVQAEMVLHQVLVQVLVTLEPMVETQFLMV